MALETGLVSVYNFLGNANDSFGSNHGVVTGCTQTNGKVLNGYFFDNVNDKIVVDDAGDISGNITVELWFYPTSVSTVSALYWAGNTSNFSSGTLMTMETNRTIHFSQNDGTTRHYKTSTGTVTLNQWNHVIGVWDGSNIYLWPQIADKRIDFKS